MTPSASSACWNSVGRGLAGVLRDDDAADVEADAAERVDQAQHVHIIGDAQIAAALVLLDVARVDGDDDLRLLLQLEQHFHLSIRLKARQDARGVIVVKELAAELEIELAAEAVDPLENLFRIEAVNIVSLSNPIFVMLFFHPVVQNFLIIYDRAKQEELQRASAETIEQRCAPIFDGNRQDGPGLTLQRKNSIIIPI